MEALSDSVRSLTIQIQEQKSEIDVVRTRLQCLHDEVCRMDRGGSSGLDVTIWSSMQNEIKVEFDKLRKRLECVQDEVCRTNQDQKGFADKDWVNRALNLKADKADLTWVQQALCAKADQGDHEQITALRTRLECLQDEVCRNSQEQKEVATLRTRLECLQDEVCRNSQEQKGLADKAWVTNALQLKADTRWVEEAFATLRTRLECMQDEVCRTCQDQKSLADKDWVNRVLNLKADTSFVVDGLKEKADLIVVSHIEAVRTRLECMQDEVCRTCQEQKGLADKSWVIDALKDLMQKANQGDHGQITTLRTRLECLQDEVCRIDQTQKGLVERAWVTNSHADDSLRVRLECLHNEVCRIDKSLKETSFNAGLKAYVEEQLEMRLVTCADLSEISQLRASLSYLQDEVRRVVQSSTKMNTDIRELGKLTWSLESLMGTVESLSGKVSNLNSGDSVQYNVHEVARRLHALICALINLYTQGNVAVRRVGGGYDYEVGTNPGTLELVDVLNSLIKDGFPQFCKTEHMSTQHREWPARPLSKSRSISPGRTMRFASTNR